MCEFCVKHGAGEKWYLNARNFIAEKAEDRRFFLEWNTEFFRNYERCVSANIKWAVDLAKAPGIGWLLRLVGDRRFPKQGSKPPYGFVLQIVPLKDSQLVARLAQRITCIPCACRKMARALDEYTCIVFDIVGEGAGRFPEYRPRKAEPLSSEETVELLGKLDERGYVHTVCFHPIPYVGAICNCSYPACQQLRLRKDYHFRTVLKAEYVAQANADTCTGCGRCLGRCQFDALQLVEGRASVNATRCFGCGLCQTACENDAIEVLPREGVPLASTSW